MKKRYIILPLFLLLLLGIGFVAYKSLNSLESAIKHAIQTYGSDILQAEVSLQKVNLDITDGTAGLGGLKIGNPKGYKTEHAMKVADLQLRLDLDSITNQPIVIKDILVMEPDIIFEKLDGVSNFDALLNNIEAYTGESEASDEDGSSAPKIVIENLRVQDAKVGASFKLIEGKALSLPMPDIHLKDIGKDKGGASPAEAAREIMGSMNQAIGSVLGGIKDGAANVLKKGKEGAKKVGDKLKGLFE